MKVFVYFNLHRKLWSIRAEEGPERGRVIGHADKLCLHTVSCKVSAKIRDRVRQTKRKEVHAGLVGYLNPSQDMSDLSHWEGRTVPLYYNPYKVDTFVNGRDHAEPFISAQLAFLDASDRSVEVSAPYSAWGVSK